MTIPEVRRLLTKKEMDKLTEQALQEGEFVIENVEKVANKKDVMVRYPKTGERKTITL